MTNSTTKALTNSRKIGFGLALLGAVLMSIDPIFIRYAGVSGFDAAFLFGLFSAISMPILLKLSDKRGIRKALTASGWPILVSGILMLGSATGLVFSIKMTSIANTFVILSATPAIAAIFSWLILKETTNRSTLFAIVAVMIGITIVVSGSVNTGNWLGDLLALFSVTCLALMFTLLRKYQDISRLAIVGLGGLLLAIVMFYFATPSSYSMETWLIMGVMGLFTAPLGRVFSMVATRHISAPEVSMTLMLETVLAPIWAFMFFSEIPANTSLLDGAVIITTIFFTPYLV
ncbi:DMT family transporter [Shewanella sp. 1_MG-2023]|uniref:DMT family transporter n=1 Tax=unclassified Shewanella TaxID=196818 RepID=UPI0026E143BA|nr:MULTISPECIES: DMT family transporter [unclassified Shewanella]MDO6611350.1 DMT family transporter [Shewanella sp. 7_MG-2023]MDO6771205.1 DMT family transporter [Shewanella sp. 2_MG-2023]MDO6795446.1 DMT family transporter [Shewanella sp. 1_MG-2023]